MSTISMVILIQWIIFVSFFIHIAELKPDAGCLNTTQSCGDMDIPYPFGIAGKRNNCGLPGFEITCKQNESFAGTTQPNPFLPLIPSGEVQILNFSDHHVLVNTTQFYASDCPSSRNTTSFEMSNVGPFRISTDNKFVVVGCETLGLLRMFVNKDDISWGGCLSICANSPTLFNCSGDGCCYTSVPSNNTAFVLDVSALNVTSLKSYETPCNYAAILTDNSWDLVSKSGKPDFSRDAYMHLDWAIPNATCASAKSTKGSYQCASNAECENREWGYTCKCNKGYSGDGYSNGTGCTDINECLDPALNNCYPASEGGSCVNTDGSFHCSCAKGYGDGTTNGTRCTNKSFQTLYVAIGVCVTLVAVLVGGGVVFVILKRRKWRLAKENNFRRNGGTHLLRLISSQAGDGMKIFPFDEIEKATSNFSQSLVLGSGGYGTVYKGTLFDGNVVAIKKANSREVDSKEINDFINEVVILNQINHRNVVKLLGCCLETPVPLLVYEYISNGTLFDHLFDHKYEQQHLQWQDRLRIATETAEALAYLHSSASIPIIHRDVKSSNILLDDVYTPKVADFGLSRLVPMDQTHITTLVQGTLGYLDPEYFQTVQLTEKSDVYSFGIVLLELLTGLKLVSFERIKNQSNLAIYFLDTMKTKGLIEILDSRLNAERGNNMESMGKLANLAKQCLSVEGEKRPQ